MIYVVNFITDGHGRYGLSFMWKTGESNAECRVHLVGVNRVMYFHLSVTQEGIELCYSQRTKCRYKFKCFRVESIDPNIKLLYL